MSTSEDSDKETGAHQDDLNSQLIARQRSWYALTQREIYSLIAWLGIVAVIAVAGSIVTRSGLVDWYPSLNRPWFQPPAWLFGPVWTTLYVMMAIAAWMIWKRRDETSHRRAVHFFTIVFIVQLVLNFLWSVLFFGLRSPMWAFMEICVLWIAVAFTVLLSFRSNRVAGWLLVPYLAWASIALVLNLIVWRSNI